MIYEELIEEADNRGLCVHEKPLLAHDGLINDKRIAINSSLKNTIEKSCVLAEELGHYYMNVGDILDQKNSNNRKQELKGRTWAYNRLIGLMSIVKAYEHGCQSIYEIADYLEITETFLTDALKRYGEKYGVFTSVDNYIIYFQPNLGVMKIIG